MPARSRSFERAPSAATSRLASITLPSAKVTLTPSGRDSNVDTAVASQLDALGLGARTERVDQIAVLDHMGERLAGLDIAGEGQEHRPCRVLPAWSRSRPCPWIGCASADHLAPDADRLEQPTARRHDGGRAGVAARPRRSAPDRPRSRGVSGPSPWRSATRQRQPGKRAPPMTILRCDGMPYPAYRLASRLLLPGVVAGRNRGEKHIPTACSSCIVGGRPFRAQRSARPGPMAACGTPQIMGSGLSRPGTTN